MRNDLFLKISDLDIRARQKDVVKIIESGNFKRPLNKTIHHYFGKFTTLYGGRKGFTDLMFDHQQQLENISQWMGHSTIERTWKNYKSRTVTHFTFKKVA